jgi:hypothetical protein
MPYTVTLKEKRVKKCKATLLLFSSLSENNMIRKRVRNTSQSLTLLLKVCDSIQILNY